MKNIFFTILVILCSCSGADAPEDLISKEKMAKVMMEVHLLEAKINSIPIDPHDSSQAVYDHYEELLFENLGVTQEQYERSFNYYVDHPDDFDEIYTAVVDSLTARE